MGLWHPPELLPSPKNNVSSTFVTPSKRSDLEPMHLELAA
jgi:hypothetical protein